MTRRAYTNPQNVGENLGNAEPGRPGQPGDSTPGPDFAALAPAIYELAEAGDAVAQGILKQPQPTVEFVLLVRAKLRRKHNIAAKFP